ncbi:GNAT family N-acetyltransferase [Solirubrobacter sp. CPCC 204708]|uniref:GNAT family N-acetyltransferase n=1 Tax=Solirubrobacter deserti TaxID=2282478 RepID=A0ABT4RPZ7_9ACTN|nr:GNAT family N-acetyltransferase [Solirubrobacter deserti]MBE2316657.1 GNAT family N-acetyltransferase [Solirubrobacter deserti]MDA0140555.1 GNAT family N-acetyltransferase [Solirubrobacter deserti]
MIIRSLTSDDEPALAALARACDETYLEWTRPGWSVPIAPPGWASKYFVPDAFIEGAFDTDLIATVAFRPSELGPSVAHVGLVFVHPSRWREGLAGMMLGRAEAEMVARGYVSEVLWTPAGAPAEQFYRSRGWARDGRTEWHPWVALDMVGYARDLP